MTTDIAFSPTVKQVQTERGSRDTYARMEAHGGFETEVTDVLRDFLAHTDTAFIASASADGQPYVQHRGGPPGFLRVLDERTLAFVDFAGNQQYITTGNLRDNDRVCLFLIDYARRRRIKIWGTARAVPASDELLAQLMPEGYRARPQQVVVITIRAWDINCPKHIPQKLDAAEVAGAIARLQARIEELERENARLTSR